MNAIFLMILICAMSAGSTFLQKTFQLETAETVVNLAFYNLINALFACCYFFAASGFKINVNMPTFYFSVAYALIVCLALVLGVCILSRVQIAAATIIQSAGSIIVSSVFGIIYFGESLTFQLFAAILLMLFAAVISAGFDRREMKSREKAYIKVIICVLSFFISGAANIISKLYAESPHVCDTVSFFFLTNANLVAASLAVLVFCVIKQQISPKALLKTFSAKQIGNVALRTALSNISSVLTVAVLAMMNISFYTVLMSSFGVIQSALMSYAFKEAMRPRNRAAVLLAIGAIIILNL